MASLQQARTRLESALDRLERALEREPAAGGDAGDLARELAAVKADYADLKTRSDKVADQLDGTIVRLRRLLGEAV